MRTQIHSRKGGANSTSLTDKEFDELADRVAALLERRFYTALGRWAFRRFLLCAGAVSCAGFLLLKGVSILIAKGLI